MSISNNPKSEIQNPKSTITVPSSTSNLGASFDTCGLALSLYLRVVVESQPSGFEIELTGEGATLLPRDESNFIVQVAHFVAEQRGKKLGGAKLQIDSQIPLARGLGSSSSAIIAGISLYEVLTGDNLTQEEFFRLAMHYENHGDNLGPCYLGGLVLACVREDVPGVLNLLAVKRRWPEAVKLIIAIPDFEMETSKMRAALPKEISMRDAIFNMQRTALLQAALSEGRYELITEALRDRIHQPYRAPLVPALSGVLEMNNDLEKFPGLLGVAISGAGSTMIAFALDGCEEIKAEMKNRIESCGIAARAMQVEVDNQGRTIS